MKTRKEWTEAKARAQLLMPKKGKPDIGPNLDKFHKLKGKPPATILAAVEKGLDLYESVPENKKNPKATELTKSMRLDLKIAQQAYDVDNSPEAMLKKTGELGAQLIKKIKPAMIVKDQALRDLFLEYVDSKELAGDVVRPAILVAAGKVKDAALRYGPGDAWNVGEHGRTILAHFQNGSTRLSPSAYKAALGYIQGGQLQMVWSTSSQSVLGRFMRNEEYQVRYAEQVLGKSKIKKLLGL